MYRDRGVWGLYSLTHTAHLLHDVSVQNVHVRTLQLNMVEVQYSALYTCYTIETNKSRGVYRDKYFGTYFLEFVSRMGIHLCSYDFCTLTSCKVRLGTFVTMC